MRSRVMSTAEKPSVGPGANRRSTLNRSGSPASSHLRELGRPPAKTRALRAVKIVILQHHQRGHPSGVNAFHPLYEGHQVVEPQPEGMPP